MLRWSRRVWSSSARPVRAADPCRFMFSDEGGVDSTVSSSSTRRARFRRGTLAGRVADAVLRAVGRLPDDDFVIFRFGVALRAVLRADFRALGRLAARLFAVFFVERVDALARPPLRL